MTAARFQFGFTLVELLVATAIGLFITAGLVTVFVNNSRAQKELDRAHMQVENGLYAMDLLSEDVRMAGYFGDFDASALTPGDVSSAGVCASAIGNLPGTMSYPIVGQSVADMASAGTACASGMVTASGSDVLALRRTTTCTQAVSGCLDIDHDPLFQVALCNSDAATYVLGYGEAHMALHTKDCTTRADIRKYLVRVYYVSPEHFDGGGHAIHNQSGDSIPTLYRLDLASGAWSPTPLVEGIDVMAFEYGVDTNGDGSPDPILDSDGDGTPDTTYVPDPAAFTCSGAAPCWPDVVTARIYLLVRSRDRTPGYTDGKTYNLGSRRIVGSTTSSPYVVGPFNDGYKRRVYSAVVQLKNVSGRRAL